MKKSIRIELLHHLIDLINDGALTDDNIGHWHYHAFNEDYYVIGYYSASQWLKRHEIDAFEAIADWIEYERKYFGEVALKPEDINSETIVNLYVYIKGEELLNGLPADTVDEFLELINDELEELL